MFFSPVTRLGVVFCPEDTNQVKFIWGVALTVIFTQINTELSWHAERLLILPAESISKLRRLQVSADEYLGKLRGVTGVEVGDLRLWGRWSGYVRLVIGTICQVDYVQWLFTAVVITTCSARSPTRNDIIANAKYTNDATSKLLDN